MEVLVALAILSSCAIGFLKSSSYMLKTSKETSIKAVVSYALDNKIKEIKLLRLYSSVGYREFESRIAERSLKIKCKWEDTNKEALKKITCVNLEYEVTKGAYIWYP